MYSVSYFSKILTLGVVLVCSKQGLEPAGRCLDRARKKTAFWTKAAAKGNVSSFWSSGVEFAGIGRQEAATSHEIKIQKLLKHHIPHGYMLGHDFGRPNNLPPGNIIRRFTFLLLCLSFKK